MPAGSPSGTTGSFGFVLIADFGTQDASELAVAAACLATVIGLINPQGGVI